MKRTTHLGIAAHQDDLEILALHGILKGLHSPCFGGIVLTNGSGSPRSGKFKDLTDEQMQLVRHKEQIRAAHFGRYSFIAQLSHNSQTIKTNKDRPVVVDELVQILKQLQPEIIYTHAPTDKHDTHVAVLICVLEALQKIPKSQRPSSLLGCEVWRDLDWVPEDHLVKLDVSNHEAFAVNLMGTFESQLAGGKRYDLASAGRRRAQATFRSSTSVDTASEVILALELSAFIETPDKIVDHIKSLQEEFQKDSLTRLERYLK